MPLAFTVTFPTRGPVPGPSEIATWLTEQGEPFEQDGEGSIALRALPVRLVIGGTPTAQLQISPDTNLARLVEVLFKLSIHLGSDVRLAGRGEVTRSSLWLHLADEQDRLRIAAALHVAGERGKHAQVARGLWALLSCAAPGRDVRWDVARNAVVEMKEVGPSGISVDEAAWHAEDPRPGDIVPLPVDDPLHVLAWRWLSQAFPGLT